MSTTTDKFRRVYLPTKSKKILAALYDAVGSLNMRPFGKFDVGQVRIANVTEYRKAEGYPDCIAVDFDVETEPFQMLDGNRLIPWPVFDRLKLVYQQDHEPVPMVAAGAVEDEILRGPKDSISTLKTNMAYEIFDAGGTVDDVLRKVTYPYRERAMRLHRSWLKKRERQGRDTPAEPINPPPDSGRCAYSSW